MRKLSIILIVLLLVCSCDMNTQKQTESKGVLTVPAEYVGTWYCSSAGGMEWIFTKDNAVFFSTSTSLNVSSLGASVQSYVGSSDGMFYIKFNDSMYEKFFIYEGKLNWRSSNSSIGYIFTKQ